MTTFKLGGWFMRWVGMSLGCLLWFGSLQAQTQPDWLQQAAEIKHRAPAKALTLLQEQEAIFSSLPAEQQALWLSVQATALSHLGRYSEQQQAAQQGLALVSEQAGTLQIELMLELGYAAEMQLALADAVDWYQNALQQAIALSDARLRLRAVINLAATDLLQERDHAALQALKNAYQEVLQLEDKELSAEIHAQLGLMYSTLSFAEEATDFLQQALTLYTELGWPRHRITVLYNLARNYSQLQNFAAALQHYDLMLIAARQEQDLSGIYHAYSGLGITNNEMGRSQLALNYMEKAEEFLPVIQADFYRAGHHFEKALIYKQLQQTSLALQQLQLAEEYLVTIQPDGAEGHKLLSLLYLKAELLASQGQYEWAYQQLLAFVKGFQQVRDKENELALEKTRLNFEADRDAANVFLREQELQVQALRLAEQDRHQTVTWLWLTLALVTALLVVCSSLLFRTNRRLTTELNRRSEHSQDTP